MVTLTPRYYYLLGILALTTVLLCILSGLNDGGSYFKQLLSMNPSTPSSQLEKSLDVFTNQLRYELSSYLLSWTHYNQDVCPESSDYFAGAVQWFMRTSHYDYREFWEGTSKGYLENFLNNKESTAVEEDLWFHEKTSKLKSVHGRVAVNLLLAEQAVASRKFKQPSLDVGSVAPSKITIISGSDVSSGSKLLMASQAIEQRKEFAKYHGNKFRFYNFTQWKGDKTVEHPVWLKIPLLEHTFKSDPECEWIWWLDMDAVIMNGNLNISRDILNPTAMEQIYLKGVPVFEERDQYSRIITSPTDFNYEDIDFIVSQDLNGMNMGSFMIHRSQITDELLQIWSDPLQVRNSGHGPTQGRREQDAFIRLYTYLEYLRKHTAIIGSPFLNSYVFNCTTRYAFGDSILHFAGRSEYAHILDEWNMAMEKRTKPGQEAPHNRVWGTLPAGEAV